MTTQLKLAVRLNKIHENEDISHRGNDPLRAESDIQTSETPETIDSGIATQKLWLKSLSFRNNYHHVLFNMWLKNLINQFGIKKTDVSFLLTCSEAFYLSLLVEAAGLFLTNPTGAGWKRKSWGYWS